MFFQAGEAGVLKVVFEAETERRVRGLHDLHCCRGDLGTNPITRRHEYFHLTISHEATADRPRNVTGRLLAF